MPELWNFAVTQEALADALPDREAIVFRGKRFTRDEYRRRSRRLANYLRSKGLGKIHKERKDLEPWESGQDHLGLYLYNGNEYLEGMFGSYWARVAPFNVNYRYVDEELTYLLKDSKCRGLIYHARLAPVLEKIRKNLPGLELLLQVADESGNALLPGAVDYEEALASSSEEKPDAEPSPDDLYILYTGGTTGMPKGVLWRQEDILFAAMGGTLPTGQKVGNFEQMIRLAKAMGAMVKMLPLPPFMHGAAHWASYMAFHTGGTVFIQDHPDRLEPDEVLSLVEKEKITTMLIVGDAFAVPLIDQLKKKQYDIKLTTIGSGGAILSPAHKEELMRLLPRTVITDALGSSESGAQGVVLSIGGKAKSNFTLGPNNVVLSEDLTRVLAPGCGESGWLARRGHIPLGYLGDPEKTKKTFVTVEGTRYSIPGDHARPEKDGTLTLFGRGSVCINTGGEKVYPEEVEKILKAHPAIYDAVVVGTPNEKWGSQVTGVVQLRAGAAKPSLEEVSAHCKGHLAGYKIPKDIVWVGEMVRAPSGKADYRWAKATAEKALGIA